MKLGVSLAKNERLFQAGGDFNYSEKTSQNFEKLMAVRKKFLADFSEICDKFSESVSIYRVLDLENTLGITFSDLNKLSNELSSCFLKLFENNIQYVGVDVSDYFLLPCFILAIWKSGFSFAGIGTQYSVQDTFAFLNNLGVKYLITDKDDANYDGNIIFTFYVHCKKFLIWNRDIVIKPKLFDVWDICYGIMTSGTTGSLKVIQVCWSCIMPNIKELTEIFQVTNSDCIYLASPCTFDPFFVELFLALLNGSSLVIVPNSLKLSSSTLIEILFNRCNCNMGSSLSVETPAYLKEPNIFPINMRPVLRKQVTILQMTPSVLMMWSNKEVRNFILCKGTSLRILVLGGEKFPQEILKLKSSENTTRIFNIYGITEISCWAFISEVTQNSFHSQIPLGKEMQGIVYKINEKNELIIGSSSRICLVDDDKTCSLDDLVFRNTGDVVKFCNDELYFICRSNKIVKKYGIKIDLGKVEELFRSSNKSIRSCFCIFDEYTLKLGLFYRPIDTSPHSTIKIVSYDDFIAKGYTYPEEGLKDIEKPNCIFELAQIPVNYHGKCDRKQMLQYMRDLLESQKSQLDIPLIFKSIWKDVLGANACKAGGNSFLELGGTSVLALEMVNKLQDAGVAVPPNFLVLLLNKGTEESCLKCLTSTPTFSAPSKRKKLNPTQFESSDMKLSVKWKLDLGKCVDATATVFRCQGSENKKVVIGSHSRKLACIDANSGQPVWVVMLGDRIESGVAVNRASTLGFVGCYDCHVYCLSLADGNVIWKHKTGDMVKSTPCLSTSEEIVFVASYDRCLHCLSVEDGRVIKILKLGEKGIFSSGVINDHLNAFFIATLSGACVAIAQGTQEIIWKQELESPVFASLCLVGNEKLLCAEVLGTLHIFSAVDGTSISKFSANGLIYSTPVFHQPAGISYIVFGCNDSCVYCLRMGKELTLEWKQQMDSPVFSRVSVFTFGVETRVCLASTKGFVYLCDFQTGNVQTSLKLEGEVFSSPVVCGSYAFVGCRDNNVYGLEMGSEFPTEDNV